MNTQSKEAVEYVREIVDQTALSSAITKLPGFEVTVFDSASEEVLQYFKEKTQLSSPLIRMAVLCSDKQLASSLIVGTYYEDVPKDTISHVVCITLQDLELAITEGLHQYACAAVEAGVEPKN